MRGDRDAAANAMREHIIMVRDEYDVYALSLSPGRRS
jgi:DNA-binding GntR family transcriptional regulator